MRVGIGIGTNRAPSGDAGGFDLPILRRDMLQEDEFFVLQEDASGKIVFSFGTYDRIALEDGTDLLLTENSDKFILTVY
jgi:hypothetical protein